MLSFIVPSSISICWSHTSHVQVFTCAESLGAVESLAESPAVMTHASVPPEVRAKLGISDALVRLSVGIEDLKDLVADLNHALACSAKAAATVTA